MESDIQFNNLPVVSPNLLSESPVEIPQHGFAVEIEQMSEPGPSRHVTQVQQEELLAHTNTFLNGFEDTQKLGTPNMSEPPRVPPFASFGKTRPQDVKVRRNPNRNVRRPVPQGGHALPPTAPVAPRAPVSRPAVGRAQRNRKRFGSSFPEEDWPLMRSILDSCDFPRKHRFQTCGQGDCDLCQVTPCTPATENKCKACAKKWVNNGVARSRHACERREGCPRWFLKRCTGCHWQS